MVDAETVKAMNDLGLMLLVMCFAMPILGVVLVTLHNRSIDRER